MTDLEREAREAAEVYRVACGLGTVGSGQLTHEAIGYAQGFYDAAAPREQELRRLRLLAEEQLTTLRKLKAEMLSDTRDQEIERLRAKLDEAKSAIRWMHGYDEPGTEDFPFCPEGKRFAWRSVARQQFAIVREACAEPIPLPETKT